MKETVTKSVWQFHDKADVFQPVFDYFRHATNEAIRVGNEKNLTSRKELHGALYYPLRESFYAKYTQGAIACAKSKLKLYLSLIHISEPTRPY